MLPLLSLCLSLLTPLSSSVCTPSLLSPLSFSLRLFFLPLFTSFHISFYLCSFFHSCDSYGPSFIFLSLFLSPSPSLYPFFTLSVHFLKLSLLDLHPSFHSSLFFPSLPLLSHLLSLSLTPFLLLSLSNSLPPET